MSFCLLFFLPPLFFLKCYFSTLASIDIIRPSWVVDILFFWHIFAFLCPPFFIIVVNLISSSSYCWKYFTFIPSLHFQFFFKMQFFFSAFSTLLNLFGNIVVWGRDFFLFLSELLGSEARIKWVKNLRENLAFLTWSLFSPWFGSRLDNGWSSFKRKTIMLWASLFLLNFFFTD